MADSPTLGSILTPEQAEAATNALQCYLDSAENVLKYRSVYVEAVETKKILVQTEIKLQEKNEVVKKLESAISVIAAGGNKEGNRARLEIAEARKELEIMTEQKRKVATEMKDARQSLAKKGKEYAEMQNENSELKKAVETLAANLQNVTAAKEEAARRLGAANMQLGVYDKYTANLMDLNIAELYVCIPSRFSMASY
jgi:chromosome segregation ATPase